VLGSNVMQAVFSPLVLVMCDVDAQHSGQRLLYSSQVAGSRHYSASDPVGRIAVPVDTVIQGQVTVKVYDCEPGKDKILLYSYVSSHAC
jgi:hypothetical protein